MKKKFIFIKKNNVKKIKIKFPLKKYNNPKLKNIFLKFLNNR